MPKYVYDFTEGNKDLKDLLGGKGANLAEMTNLGLPVPPGFTITTEACRRLPGRGRGRPDGLDEEVTEHLAALESAMGQTPRRRPTTRCWSACAPARSSRCPGMMETVLNIGLNDESVHGLAKQSAATSASPGTPTAGSSRCSARPCSASTASCSRTRSTRPSRQGRPPDDLDLDADDLQRLVDDVQGASSGSRPARTSPQTRASRCDLAVKAVFDSWNADRAPSSTAARSASPTDLGTAVNVCSMVFGNLGMDSGTGVAFTRDPGTGAPGRLRRLPAERPGRGRRRRHPQHRPAAATWSASTSTSTTSCMTIMETLENHYRDLCDIEFTIERGKLWMLQTRVGKRTAGRRVPHRHRSSSTRASSTWTRRCTGSPAPSSPS